MVRPVLLYCLVVICLVLSDSVVASQLQPRWYWSHQHVDYVHERVTVSNDLVFVEFEGDILVDDGIHNDSEWITFEFSPLWDKRQERLVSYNSSVQLEDGRTNYRAHKDNNSVWIYNVSLRGHPDWNTIHFEANFTIDGKVAKIDDFDYNFFYYSSIEAKNQDLTIIFPFTYEPKYYPPWIEFGFGRTARSVVLMGEDAKKTVYITFQDVNAMKIADRNRQRLDWAVGALLTVVGAILGVALPFFKEVLQEALFKLKYHFLWTAREKRRWEALARKHQLPKSMRPTKNMTVVRAGKPIRQRRN